MNPRREQPVANPVAQCSDTGWVKSIFEYLHQDRCDECGSGDGEYVIHPALHVSSARFDLSSAVVAQVWLRWVVVEAEITKLRDDAAGYASSTRTGQHLLGPQRDRRVDSGCAQRRNKGGEQRRREEDQRRRDEHERLNAVDAVQHALKDLPSAHGEQ